MNLKRAATVSYELCIICQETKNDQLFKSSEKGLHTIKEAANARHQFRDFTFRESVDRILAVTKSETDQSLTWHKVC